MLLINVTPLTLFESILTALIGMVALSAALSGYLLARLHWVSRLALAAAALLLLDPGAVTDLIGLAVLAAIGTVQVLKARREKSALEVKT
jgi:TRAP-type uncharacterized transport system fused permease subunit